VRISFFFHKSMTCWKEKSFIVNPHFWPMTLDFFSKMEMKSPSASHNLFFALILSIVSSHVYFLSDWVGECYLLELPSWIQRESCHHNSMEILLVLTFIVVVQIIYIRTLIQPQHVKLAIQIQLWILWQGRRSLTEWCLLSIIPAIWTRQTISTQTTPIWWQAPMVESQTMLILETQGDKKFSLSCSKKSILWTVSANIHYFMPVWLLPDKFITIINILANQAPALPGKNLMSLCNPSGHFTSHKVFSPMTHLGFGVWGTRGSGW